MNYLFTFFTALVVSMVIIPLMIRLAPRLGMIDYPDQRKVHAQPIPRVGGVGVVIGALIPILMWLPLDEAVRAYLFGSLVLLIFGMWDDSRDINPYLKFIGQIIAASAVVYYGDVYIASLPLMDMEPLPTYVAKPITIFTIVGMINALNMSDGLDGLAAGLSILSLSCIAYLAYLAEGFGVIAITAAALGGILGFLRYNTHPARVFMGDAGSQFLGFTLGFLAVLFTQKINPAVSPALALLFLGLPIIDILAVIAQRLHYGISPFVATKHHLHHRLLELGFDHYEAVVIIYSIQTFFVVSAIFLMYESDALILSIYLGVCALVFSFLVIAEKQKWRAHKSKRPSGLAKVIDSVKRHRLFSAIPMRFVSLAVPALFVSVGFATSQVPRDLAVVSALLAAILLLYLVLHRAKDTTVLQVVVYVTAAFVVYLETRYCRQWALLLDTIEIVYFSLLVAAIAITIRYGRKDEFKTTPMDYLVIFVVLFVGFLLHNQPERADLGDMAIKLMIIFYACELIITRMHKLVHLLTIATLATLTIFAVRGLM